VNELLTQQDQGQILDVSSSDITSGLCKRCVSGSLKCSRNGLLRLWAHDYAQIYREQYLRARKTSIQHLRQHKHLAPHSIVRTLSAVLLLGYSSLPLVRIQCS
jgi:hypothetical protein